MHLIDCADHHICTLCMCVCACVCVFKFMLSFLDTSQSTRFITYLPPCMCTHTYTHIHHTYTVCVQIHVYIHTHISHTVCVHMHGDTGR